ncbi:hypothetical protein C5167_017807 [Papaver somniferum]|uniref:Major facilitator superfamily (MFS) profile domain-containing protein n=1 Tax=Papaver somniferum TaxID=3469 RepID=A0A4Y7INU9_PAPSO|nr:protein NRT1/ PTR FAMILY 5.8-like [Papaver somniferum]RZC49382.1 hypothetical protein C5167_017807 [Papaver somniferum]
MARGGGRLPSIMLNKSCILIIVVAAVERFAFKGVASNLVTYLTEVMKMSNSTAAKTVNSWAGISFLLPLFGAFLADSYLDRYSTIFSSSIVYVTGLVSLTFTALVWEWIAKSTNDHEKTSSSPFSPFLLFLSLFLIALGQGGYNPCLQVFGADQLQLRKNDNQLPTSNNNEDGDANDENISNEKIKSMFFKWWYFGICSGSLLGVSLMSYLQDTFGWGLGFAIPCIAMAMSVTPFSCGTRFYTVIEEQPKSVRGTTGNMIKSLVNSIKSAAQKLMHRDYVALPSNLSDAEAGELEPQQKALCSQHSGDQQSDNMPNGAVPVVDIVEETKSVARIMPIWGMLLTFAIIFQQPATFFTKQGMAMKRNMGNHFMIPPATLQSAINVSIILLMPLYDKIVTPVYRIISGSDKGINVMQRMGFGMFLSVIAMSIAAIVETKRLEISRREPTMNSVPLCIFWLLPQYILLGISDVFTVVGMQEFFYSEVPNKLKTMGMALHLSVFGVGSFLSAILISFIELVTSVSNGKHSWFSDDMCEAQLNKYYWFLAFSSALSLFFFAIYSHKYYK